MQDVVITDDRGSVMWEVELHLFYLQNPNLCSTLPRQGYDVLWKKFCTTMNVHLRTQEDWSRAIARWPTWAMQQADLTPASKELCRGGSLMQSWDSYTCRDPNGYQIKR